MKANKLLLMLCLLVTKVSGQYINPIIQAASTSTALDAKVEIQLVGLKPPYSYIEWYDDDGWQNSGAFHVENIGEPDHVIIVGVIDSVCRYFETFFYVYHDQARQVLVDTIIISMPTPGNHDGSIQVQYGHLPTGYIRHFGSTQFSLPVVSTNTYTNLAAGNYELYVQDPNNGWDAFSIRIPLMVENLPCGHFDTELDWTLPTTSSMDQTGCDASFTVNNTSALTGDYSGELDFYYVGGGSSIETSIDPFGLEYDDLCRTIHRLFVSNEDTKFQYHFYSFLPDSSDTYYTWNEPSPMIGVDTLPLQSIYNCAVDPSVAIDTVYVDDYISLGANQFEITFAIVQGSDTFYVYEAPILDSAADYLFNMIIHCDIDGDFPYVDHTQHFIYFEALNTRSDFFKPETNVPITDNKIKVYPNPFNDQMNVYSSRKIRLVEIYSINGKLTYTANINSNVYTVETSGLPPSIYLLKVYSEEGSLNVSKITKL